MSSIIDGRTTPNFNIFSDDSIRLNHINNLFRVMFTKHTLMNALYQSAKLDHEDKVTLTSYFADDVVAPALRDNAAALLLDLFDKYTDNDDITELAIRDTLLGKPKQSLLPDGHLSDEDMLRFNHIFALISDMFEPKELRDVVNLTTRYTGLNEAYKDTPQLELDPETVVESAEALLKLFEEYPQIEDITEDVVRIQLTSPERTVKVTASIKISFSLIRRR